MVNFLHKFVSAKADGPDSTLVKPSNWNDEHNVTTAADGVVLGVPAGAGAGPVQEMPIANVFPPGYVATFAGATIPAGWLLCDGSLYNRADHPALFTAIGAAYNIGGESTAQFRVPDCRGRVIAALDGGVGRLTTNNINNPNVVGGVGGVDTRQTRVYGYVDVSVTVSGSLGGQSGGPSAPMQTVSNQSGPTVDVATQGHVHYTTVSGSLGGSGSGNIRVDGNNSTDPFAVAQPTIMMNMMIKT
jgi:microcystin-dependent protein